MRKLAFVLLVLLLFNTVAYASSEKVVYNNSEVSYNKDSYTDTINAVFDRLNGKVFEKPSEPVPGGYKAPSGEGQTPTNSIDNSSDDSLNGSSGNHNSNDGPPSKEYFVPGIPDTYKGSVLERMQADSKITTGDVAGTVDSIGTTIHYTVSQWVVGLAPILLIIAVGLMLFSSSKAAGFLLMCGVAIFVILFAPELVKIFINSITGIFY